jgi:hypothetical protein
MLEANAPVPLGWIEQGVRHGFPGCCILFFCTVWREWLNRQRGHGDDTAQQYKRMLKRRGWPTDGYIPCPTCVAQRAGLDVGPGPGNVGALGPGEEARGDTPKGRKEK